ncbi:hypothetical protein BK141_00095 [Paenibacillus sp. FSL R5-0765]|nr:hypothetical protein BK141_00095 [Paenibacillus sp. FSL R5-0765]
MKYLNTRRKRFMFACLLIVVIYFSLSGWISMEVKKTIRSVLLTEDFIKNEKNIKKEAFDNFLRFSGREVYPLYNKNDVEIDVVVSQPISIHYFVGGYAWMTYRYRGIDKKTNEILFGANAPIRIKVDLVKGRWKIIKKWEKP